LTLAPGHLKCLAAVQHMMRVPRSTKPLSQLANSCPLGQDNFSHGHSTRRRLPYLGTRGPLCEEGTGRLCDSPAKLVRLRIYSLASCGQISTPFHPYSFKYLTVVLSYLAVSKSGNLRTSIYPLAINMKYNVCMHYIQEVGPCS